jgi:hypothetical protein
MKIPISTKTGNKKTQKAKKPILFSIYLSYYHFLLLNYKIGEEMREDLNFWKGF